MPPPSLPLPPRICSDVPGTWAYDTMSRRVREDILSRVFRENNFHPHITDKLKVLDAELAGAVTTVLTPIAEDGGPDVTLWNTDILAEALEGDWTWLSAPWALAEFYFYRRMMSALDYFRHPVDPFQMQKELGLTSSISSISTLANKVNGVLNSLKGRPREKVLDQLRGFILTALWGNRMDLSLWPVGGDDAARTPDAFADVLEAGQKYILANDMDQLVKYIEGGWGAGRMDIVVDNAGFELFCDLCLADFLVVAGVVDVVYLQLKAHPTFVSDAMGKDVRWTANFLKSEDGQVGELGERWAKHIAEGTWVLKEDFYWVQPQAMWDMPVELKVQLRESKLVFVKGDANYRRLLGDRDWELDTPFYHILEYFPAPVCALRMLKAELGCGMSREETDRASQEDKRWLVAGKYGVVQFCNTKSL